MIGLCFHHEEFDSDISSGTIFAIDQWSNLISSIGVENIAIINLTEEELPPLSNDLTTTVYSSLDDFLAVAEGNIAHANPRGDIDYKDVNYNEIDWLVIGATKGNDFQGGIKIPTRGFRELYPREAAAIILAEAAWHIL